MNSPENRPSLTSPDPESKNVKGSLYSEASLSDPEFNEKRYAYYERLENLEAEELAKPEEERDSYLLAQLQYEFRFYEKFVNQAGYLNWLDMDKEVRGEIPREEGKDTVVLPEAYELAQINFVLSLDLNELNWRERKDEKKSFALFRD